MAGTEPERIIIANWNARIAWVIVLFVFAAASVGGIYDPVDRSARGDLWPGALFVVVAIIVAVRSLAVGVVVVGDKVISRGWLRTRTTFRADISAVRAANYSGILNGSGRSGLFLMVELEVFGKDDEILALVGRPTKVKRLADQLRVALGLETNSAEAGQHRIHG